MSILDGFYSLASKVNKQRDENFEEGIASDILPELELPMSDEDIIEATRKFRQSWDKSEVKAEWLQFCEQNENYWKGKQFGKLETEQLRPLVDNVIFESLETFLPRLPRETLNQSLHSKRVRNGNLPGTDQDPMLQQQFEAAIAPKRKFADDLKAKLADWADETKIRLKIKRVARHWSIFLLGAGKMGWDIDNDRPQMLPRRAKNLILDPESWTMGEEVR